MRVRGWSRLRDEGNGADARDTALLCHGLVARQICRPFTMAARLRPPGRLVAGHVLAGFALDGSQHHPFP